MDRRLPMELYTSALSIRHGDHSSTLTVNYNKGCLVSASATIIVVGDIAVAIPNAFTSNGDGINDDYHILTHGVADFSMRIYNRHDRLIYATDDINKGWDGNCLG